jgi:hypothetical protein
MRVFREGSKLLEDKRLSTNRKRQQSASARQETMAERRGHEAGLSAAASQAEAWSKQLEREGKFLIDQVEDGVVAKRNAPKVVTEERLMTIASQPIKGSKKAA